MAESRLDGVRAARTGCVQPPAVSTPHASVTAPFCPVRGPGEAVALSQLSLGMGSGLCPCSGFSGPGAAPGEALVPMGNHLHLHPSLPLLHPVVSSIGLMLGAERRRCARPCLSTAGLSSVSPRDGDGPGFSAGIPGQGAVGAWCLHPSHPCAPAPCAPLGPVLGRMSRDFPAPAPVKSRALAARRAGPVPQPCQDHPQATPGVPDGKVEGAGTHRGSCAVLATDTWMCPLWPMGHVESSVPGLVE